MDNNGLHARSLRLRSGWRPTR